VRPSLSLLMLLLLGIYILKMSLYSSLSVQCTLRRTSKSVLTFFPMSVEDKTRSPETDDCGLATPHLRGAAGSSWSSSLVDSGQSGLSRLPSRCCRERRGARARGRPRAGRVPRGRRRARGPTPTRGARPPAERLQSERKSSKCPRRSLSADGARVGTPGCAAPTRGARVPDVRSKVHSLQYTYGPTTPTHDG